MGFVHSMYPVFDYSILFSITPVSIAEGCPLPPEVVWFINLEPKYLECIERVTEP